MLSRLRDDRLGGVLLALSLGTCVATGVAAGTGHLSWPAATLLSGVAAAPDLLRRTLRDDDDDDD